MNLQKISNNLSQIVIGDYKFWFSYETIVAFQESYMMPVISENIWSTTTGKHLNYINADKSIRINHSLFELRLDEVLRKFRI